MIKVKVPIEGHRFVTSHVSIRKLLLLSTTWDQPNRAGLSLPEKFMSPDVFYHCIVTLKNGIIVRLKIAKFQPV